MNVKFKARASFLNLFKPRAFAGEGDGDATYQATAILDKAADADTIKTLAEAMAKLLKDTYPGGVPKGFKLCLRDGIEKEELDGYGAGVRFIPMNAKNKPPVVDRNLKELNENSGRPYNGCYCIFSARFWVQDNKFGKRVNCQIRAVQFHSDGEPFSSDAPVNIQEEFEALDDEAVSAEYGDADEAEIAELKRLGLL